MKFLEQKMTFPREDLYGKYRHAVRYRQDENLTYDNS
jgi:hypothetical protein